MFSKETQKNKTGLVRVEMFSGPTLIKKRKKSTVLCNLSCALSSVE